ncbi:hypothetical protein B7P43_G04046 [Cryptotermes secundus]|uniref:HMG box domain-containing protein n=1 Tax=Cryptotermes secundus TaxID=105785 RepID=A0A2J7RCJ5_9NEOP|nr:hypothetical protein B7P43_G04046 [Cryptotermes secundus]
MPMKQLPSSTVKLITSTQIVTSVSGVVKELMENALDGEATSIDVILENNGLDRIDVKDNGCGIKRTDTPYMCLPSYTSKIGGYADLDKLQSYGFRGEALSAICRVADVTVTTRTNEDELAMVYTLNHDGNIVATKPSHFAKGTLVTVNKLFRNLPVRKNYLNAGRRAAEELKRADNIAKSLAVIHPSLRVTFCHNKCLLWQKAACTSLQQSVMQVVGYHISNNLEELVLQETELNVDMLVPKRDTENFAALCSSNIECMMLYVNKRPVRYKKLEKMVLKYTAECFSGQPLTHKYPFCLLSIVMSPGGLDANLEPNKTRVLLKEEDEVLSKIEILLSSYYEVKEDPRQMSNAPDTTAVCEGESTYAPNIQHISGMNRGKADSIEQKGREWKQLKVDTAVGGKAENVAVVLTQIGKERFLNAAGADLMESVSHEERDSCVNNKLGNVVQAETLTSASEMACNGWTVTKNMYTSGNQNPDCRFASRETDIGPSVGPSNTNVPETSLNEQSEKDGHDSHLHCNELMLGSSTEHEFGHEPASAAADFELRNGEHEVEIQGMDQTRSNSTNTRTLNELDSVTNVIQKTHTSIASSTEKSAQSVLKDVTQGDDLNFFFSSDFDEEMDCCSSNNSKIISVPSDRSSVTQNTGKTDSEKQPCLISDLVSDVTNTAAIPLPGIGEHVWDDGDFAMVWSKGQLKGSNGKVMQGPSVLLPKSATSRKMAETLNSSNHSVSSQMGCKEQSAFTKFARQERPKVLKEFPGIAFTKVSELLVERWRALPVEEHIKYEKLAKEMDKKRKYSADRISGEQVMSVKSFMSKSWNKKICQRPYRREMALDVSLNKLKEDCVPAHNELMDIVPILIGQLRPSGTWLYRKENEIGVVRHWGLQETVVYYRLMLDHSIPLMKLDSSIPLDESILGPELWKILLSLKKTYDIIKNAVIITSDVISKNGFRIELTEGSGRAYCMLTETASNISFYGVNDLKDVLELIKKNGSSCLEKCRPERVKCYIRDEAVRIARQCPGIMERETLQDLVHYWQSNLTHLGATCLHRKPFFFVLKDLSEVELQKQKN